jgi:hypothetical protein
MPGQPLGTDDQPAADAILSCCFRGGRLGQGNKTGWNFSAVAQQHSICIEIQPGPALFIRQRDTTGSSEAVAAIKPHAELVLSVG